MKIKKEFQFRNTSNNRELAGKTITYEVPKFEWEIFINLPNAKKYIEQIYNSDLQKIVREALLEKNGTSDHHLQSIESVIARSISFTKQEIETWCRARDWTSISLNSEQLLKITNLLASLAVSEALLPVNTEEKNKLAEIVVEISEIKTDPIAEYLWVKLTQANSDAKFDLNLL